MLSVLLLPVGDGEDDIDSMCQKKEQIDLPQMFLNHHSSNIKQCVSEPILILRNAAAEPISGPARDDHGVLENLFAGTTPAPATQSQITTTAFLVRSKPTANLRKPVTPTIQIQSIR